MLASYLACAYEKLELSLSNKNNTLIDVLYRVIESIVVHEKRYVYINGNLYIYITILTFTVWLA